MLNSMLIEGVVLKTWTYAGTPFLRLVNRPDPGIDGGDMLVIARLPGTVPIGLRPGDQVRLHGRFFNRRKEEGSDDYVGEIHAERVVLVARNQLRKPRANGDRTGSSDENTATEYELAEPVM
ncbi:MAG: hypothetical protein JW934_19055 [Anaerolineae bacterium]|nr:hypothetical protein [Anaerolineae bacterium]